MDYIKVSGHDGLVRDQNTGAIINLDDSAIEARSKTPRFRVRRHKYVEE